MQSPNESTMTYFKRVYTKHGILSLFFSLCLRIINKFFEFKVLNIFYRDHVNYSSCGADLSFYIKKLNQSEINNYFGKGYNDISAEETKKLLKSGAQCFCVLDKKKDQIAAYSWFIFNECDAGIAKYVFKLTKNLVYTFKVYTAPEYRGLQLHGFMMKYALNFFNGNNIKAIIGYTYSENFESIKSNKNMGSKVIGHIFVIMFMKKYYIFKLGSLKNYGVIFE